MPTNLIKTYPELLELGYLTQPQRNISLLGIFKRDFEDNPGLNFRSKKIRPIKGDEPPMALLFRHLTTEEVTESDVPGEKYVKRVFEMDRSQRLHWIRYHLVERKPENLQVFSVEERDQKHRSDIIRTYIYDHTQKYVIVLDPQRSKMDYYLVTAYYLNKEYGEKKMIKLIKRKLPELH